MVGLALLVPAAPADEPPEVHTAPRPGWVEPVPYTPTLRTGDQHPIGGRSWLILDEQIRVAGNIESYEHHAIELANEEAVNSYSQITVDFAPQYEDLTFHFVRLWRDGQSIDLLDRERIELLRREAQLEELIFDGRWTASIVLHDVRRSDVLEYAWTIRGQNPAFADLFSRRFDLQYGFPIGLHHIRLLWPTRRPIEVRTIKTDAEPGQQRDGDTTIYRYQRRDVQALGVDSGAPVWHDPWPRFVFSNTASWSEVVEWALPFYERSATPHPDVATLAAQIKQDFASAPGRAASALRYVQDEIRYLGIEIGDGGFVPHAPELTAQQRFGDCKAKVLLLLALFDELGIEASPALVDSDYGETLDEDGPRIGAFNHVIVRAEIGQTSYWLDPTLNGQRGSLDRIAQPDYGHALVLAEGIDDLVPMNPPVGEHRTLVREELDLRAGPGQPAGYTVTTTFTGEDADQFRRELSYTGIGKLAEQYLEYYASKFASIESTGPPRIRDIEGDNKVIVVETYTIPELWEEDEEWGAEVAYFYADAIYRSVYSPESERRTSPYALIWPLDMTQETTVLLPEDWDQTEDAVEVNNAWFDYSSDITYDRKKKRILLKYRIRGKAKSVPAADVARYMEDVERVENDLGYYVVPSRSLRSMAAEVIRALNPWEWVLLALLFLLVLLAPFVLIEAILDFRRPPPPDPGRYYPVSPVKMLLLSSLTFQGYHIYWAWKNWRYVKRRDQSRIWPALRALFFPLFYFSLARSILREPDAPEGRPARQWLLLTGVAMPLYLLTNVVSGLDHLASYAAVVLGTLLLFPLVFRVNRLSGQSSEARACNSRFRIRHVAVGILFTLAFASEVDESVDLFGEGRLHAGESLRSRHLEFMEEIGVLDDNDRPVLLYTRGVMGLTRNGGGFSDHAAFRYWRDDETKRVMSESAEFSEIERIDFSRGNYGADSTIRVRRTDGSELTLRITSEDNLDRRFERSLRRHWRSFSTRES